MTSAWSSTHCRDKEKSVTDDLERTPLGNASAIDALLDEVTRLTHELREVRGQLAQVNHDLVEATATAKILREENQELQMRVDNARGDALVNLAYLRESYRFKTGELHE